MTKRVQADGRTKSLPSLAERIKRVNTRIQKTKSVRLADACHHKLYQDTVITVVSLPRENDCVSQPFDLILESGVSFIWGPDFQLCVPCARQTLMFFRSSLKTDS
jgi:hypothetical protein